jgi:ABC-type polar amino acid transport system ATPase subunit
MIEVQSLIKRFGPLTVLSGVSVTVQRGEVAVVMGPSGGGKSTLLRCLNGLEAFQDGRLEVAGVRLEPGIPASAARNVIGQLRRRVGMVFQQFQLFPHRTVLENVIEAPIIVLKRPREEAVIEARALLDRVGLKEKCDARPESLSGGQQQRVAIARALAMRPEVILFDEPTSALDPRMAGEVEAVMADLAKSGQTMLIATHAAGLARRTAHTLHIMAGGLVIESGPPEQVLDAPREAATRELLAGRRGE